MNLAGTVLSVEASKNLSMHDSSPQSFPTTLDVSALASQLIEASIEDDSIRINDTVQIIDSQPTTPPDSNWEMSLRRKLLEGSGEVLLRLGYSNDGESLDYSEDELSMQLDRLYKFGVGELVSVTVLLSKFDSSNSNAWVLIRTKPESVEELLELRIAVVGNVDAGKSTLLGVLTKGELDDGRGKARLELFRHKHEAESGRTSSVGQELLGFDVSGKPITGIQGTRRLPWDVVCAQSSKVLTLLDLAGHERYLRTTLFGLAGGAPDYAMLLVGANAGLIGMAREHLALAFALAVPILVVVTKIDMAPAPVLDATLRQLSKALRSPACKRAPVLIKGSSDALSAIAPFIAGRLCPIFMVSNVTGVGLDSLKLFLGLLPAAAKYSTDAPTEFQITDVYSVPGAGTVVAGTMLAGIAKLGQTLYLGPDSLGQFVPALIKGVQRKRVNVQTVSAGQCSSFALKKIRRAAIRKGMVLVGRERLPDSAVVGFKGSHPIPILAPSSTLLNAKACREFEAEVVILFHATTISPCYQAVLHCGVVRQTVSIVSMANNLMRTGDRSIVRFRFLKFPEYLKIGARLLFREGRTKGVGRIVALYD